MLRACPALETLALEIQTSNHYRAITSLDLRPAPRVPSRITSPACPSMPVISAPKTDLTVLPHLRTLRLRGSWVIAQPILSDLLLKTCPKIEILHLEGWKTGSLAGLVGLVRTMYERNGVMRELRVGMHRVNGLTTEKMRHMGMFPEGHAEVVGRDILPIEVFAPGNHDAWFVLLRDHNGGKSSDAKL